MPHRSRLSCPLSVGGTSLLGRNRFEDLQYSSQPASLAGVATLWVTMHQEIGLRFDPGPQLARRDCLLPVSLGLTDIPGLPDSSYTCIGSCLVGSKQTRNTRENPSLSLEQTEALLGQEHKIQHAQASRAGRGGQKVELRPPTRLGRDRKRGPDASIVTSGYSIRVRFQHEVDSTRPTHMRNWPSPLGYQGYSVSRGP